MPGIGGLIRLVSFTFKNILKEKGRVRSLKTKGKRKIEGRWMVHIGRRY